MGGVVRWALRVAGEPLAWCAGEYVAIDKVVDTGQQSLRDGYPFDAVCLFALLLVGIAVGLVAHMNYRPRDTNG